MSSQGPESIFRRLTFMEGEWKGTLNNMDETRFTDALSCTLSDGKITGDSILSVDGDTVGKRHFVIWTEDGNVLGRWDIDGESAGTYVCEYEAEDDEFLFNLKEGPTSLDYRTIRRIDMMHFITMEQLPREGTSAVETLQMEYRRTL